MNLSKEGLLFILSKAEDEIKEVGEARVVIKIRLAEDGVNNWVVGLLSQGRFDSLVSFVYSIGVDSFKRSTLLKRLNQGKINEAASEFSRWIYTDAVRDPSLITRREEEKEMFLTPSQSQTPSPEGE